GGRAAHAAGTLPRRRRDRGPRGRGAGVTPAAPGRTARRLSSVPGRVRAVRTDDAQRWSAARRRAARAGGELPGSGLRGGALAGGLLPAVGRAAVLHLLAQLAREGEHEVLGRGAHRLHV